jgi:hypothetical protein
MESVVCSVLISWGSGVSRASSVAAEKVSDLNDALTYDPVSS